MPTATDFINFQLTSRFDEESQSCLDENEVDCTASPLPTAPTITPETTTTGVSPDGPCREARNGTYVRNMMSCSEFFVSITLL